MSKIKERVKALAAQEEKIKRQLDHDSDEVKARAIRVGKIALGVGIVTLVGYWLYNIFFGDDTEDEDKEEPRRNIKKTPTTSARIAALAMPYLNKFLDGILDEDEESAENEKEKSQS